MHFEKLSVLYNQLVQLESDIDKNSKVLIEKKTIDYNVPTYQDHLNQHSYFTYYATFSNF